MSVQRLMGGSLALMAMFGAVSAAMSEQTSAGAGSIIVMETVKGTIEIETYPQDAPKTVEHVLALVRKGFYNGHRFHRVEPKFVIQIGDPRSRDMTRRDEWGRVTTIRGVEPVGVAEFSKTRLHRRGAVGLAHAGDAREAYTQFYITRRVAPELDGKHAVFGQVIAGMTVVDQIEYADVVRKVYVKEAAAK